MPYRLYAKHETDKRFKPMDFNRGVQVTNLIYATIFDDCKYDELKKEVEFMTKMNPEYTFEIRRIK